MFFGIKYWNEFKIYIINFYLLAMNQLVKLLGHSVAKKWQCITTTMISNHLSYSSNFFVHNFAITGHVALPNTHAERSNPVSQIMQHQPFSIPHVGQTVQQAANDDESGQQHIEQTSLVSWPRYLFSGLWYPHAIACAFPHPKALYIEI